MGASPSSVQRMVDSDKKTAAANELIADIVPLLDNLSAGDLQEVKLYLEAKLAEERKGLAKETTKVYKKGVTGLDTNKGG